MIHSFSIFRSPFTIDLLSGNSGLSCSIMSRITHPRAIHPQMSFVADCLDRICDGRDPADVSLPAQLAGPQPNAQALTRVPCYTSEPGEAAEPARWQSPGLRALL